jgi:hypothetical protein
LELTAHQAQHVIVDRSTCSRNPVPMLVAHFLGHYGEALSVFGPKVARREWDVAYLDRCSQLTSARFPQG